MKKKMYRERHKIEEIKPVKENKKTKKGDK